MRKTGELPTVFHDVVLTRELPFNPVDAKCSAENVLSSGVGLVLEQVSHGDWEVADLLPGSAAERSKKIFVGDVLVSVSGVSVAGSDLSSVSSLMFGLAVSADATSDVGNQESLVPL